MDEGDECAWGRREDCVPSGSASISLTPTSNVEAQSNEWVASSNRDMGSCVSGSGRLEVAFEPDAALRTRVAAESRRVRNRSTQPSKRTRQAAAISH